MKPFARTALAAALLTLASTTANAALTAEEHALLQRVERLAAELDSVKAELAKVKAQQGNQAQEVAAVKAAAPVGDSDTRLTSYGEINLTVPTNRSADTVLDLRRFVIGFQHRFNGKTKLVTELEVEHAVSSADDAGEVAVEQAYFERELSPSLALRGGLMLMPLGFINETHEPNTFYGANRNVVETAIIPSTLREIGVQGVYSFGNGYTLQTGVVTGPNIAGWDYSSDGEGQESPLASIHQEGQFAAARDPNFFAALNWRGIPGLQLGASAIGGNIGHGTGPESQMLLWDAHARWAPGRWQLSALYAQGTLTNTRALNQPNVGMPTLIPKRFDGALLEAGYKLWRSDDLLLSPFARVERVNTARGYADLGAGLTPDRLKTETITTIGSNLDFGDGLVLKADYQFFQEANNADSFNLGLGWSF